MLVVGDVAVEVIVGGISGIALMAVLMVLVVAGVVIR